MITKHLIGAAALAALLAGCAGGGASGPATSAPTTVTPTTPTNQSSARGTLTARVEGATAAKAFARRPQQVTSGVDTITLTIDGNPADIPTTGSLCASSVCTVTLSPGSHTINVGVKHTGTPIGVSTQQTVNISAGAVTNANFTITPIPASITVSTVVRLPEDGASHTANVAVAALDAAGQTISGPLDSTIFGTVSLASSSTDAVLNNTSSSPTPAPTPVAYAQATFAFPATTLTYDGAVVNGDLITLTPSYANAGAQTFAPTSTASTILLASLSGPANNALSGGTYASNVATFSSFGTYTGYVLTEKNAGIMATGDDTTSDFAVNTTTTSSPCNNHVAITPGAVTRTGNNISKPFTITIDSGATTCIVKFTTTDWGTGSINQQLEIVPPGQGSIAIH